MLRSLGLVLMLSAGVIVSGCFAPRRPCHWHVGEGADKWVLSDVALAVRDMGDWQIQVVDSRVSEFGATPILEMLTIRVVNLSRERVLFLRPRDILISDVDVPLHFDLRETVTLVPGQWVELTYDTGSRIDPMPYPFRVMVTVQRKHDGSQPQSTEFLLH